MNLASKCLKHQINVGNVCNAIKITSNKNRFGFLKKLMESGSFSAIAKTMKFRLLRIFFRRPCVFCSVYTIQNVCRLMREKKFDSLSGVYILFFSLLDETSAGIMCYINQVTHSVGYPRFVFTNNTPYGRPSNNNIFVRFETFCSPRRKRTFRREWWCDPHR